MGSRIMHLAIANELLKELPGLDRNRFFFGALLPDAAAEGNSHRRIAVCDGGLRTYDLTGFRSTYAQQLNTDPLYLGFYLHLVQDMVFRQFVYGTYRWDPAPPGNIERLHRDYAILNGYLIGQYRLSPDVSVPPGVEAEPLLRDCSYDTGALVRDLRADFAQEEIRELFFFRREMADEYIALSVPACRREIAAIRTGAGFLDERSMAWARKGP